MHSAQTIPARLAAPRALFLAQVHVVSDVAAEHAAQTTGAGQLAVCKDPEADAVDVSGAAVEGRAMNNVLGPG
jgi:hypothetical protein